MSRENIIYHTCKEKRVISEIPKKKGYVRNHSQKASTALQSADQVAALE
jgi:hypothetical protein